WLSQNIVPYWNASFFSIDTRYILGIAAYTLTLPLLFTSNTLSIKFFGPKAWKRLHSMAYPLFLLVLFHFFLRTGRADNFVIISVLAVFSGYIFLKVLARKNFISPLRGGIAFISDRYKAFVFRKRAPLSS